ncbi:MAG: universal stress protein [Myxococcales bacterium]|nr:universal stress protein [Myxococcales bacterium]
MFKRIVVPVDRSALVARELRTALALAERFDASVTLLRVVPEGASLEPDQTQTDLNVLEQETRVLLAEALGQLSTGDHADRIRAEVRAGPVVSTILDTATEQMADLIVVGSHGRHRPIEWLTGSTAEQLVARASQSVLVIKPEGFPFLTE